VFIRQQSATYKRQPHPQRSTFRDFVLGQLRTPAAGAVWKGRLAGSATLHKAQNLPSSLALGCLLSPGCGQVRSSRRFLYCHRQLFMCGFAKSLRFGSFTTRRKILRHRSMLIGGMTNIPSREEDRLLGFSSRAFVPAWAPPWTALEGFEEMTVDVGTSASSCNGKVTGVYRGRPSSMEAPRVGEFMRAGSAVRPSTGCVERGWAEEVRDDGSVSPR